MQIIFKVKEGRAGEVEELVTKSISKALPGFPANDVTVRQVFPGVTTGQRSRLFTVDLPDRLPDQKIDEVIESLRNEDALEYAEVPAPKQPMEDSAAR